jgi:hypothetical protein
MIGKTELDTWLATRLKFHAENRKELLEAWTRHFTPAGTAVAVAAGGAGYDDAAPEWAQNQIGRSGPSAGICVQSGVLGWVCWGWVVFELISMNNVLESSMSANTS